MLQHLAVALCKPRPLLLPLWQQISQGNVGKSKVGVQLALFIVPLNSLVVDKTCTTAKARKCLDICAIWFELELKCLAKNHYTALAWQSGESQGAMRALHPHPYGWGISARLIKGPDFRIPTSPASHSVARGFAHIGHTQQGLRQMAPNLVFAQEYPGVQGERDGKVSVSGVLRVGADPL